MSCFRSSVLCLLFCLAVRVYGVSNACDAKEESVVSIDYSLGEFGEWEASVTTHLDPRISPNNSNIDVKRTLLEEDGKKTVQIKVTMRACNGITEGSPGNQLVTDHNHGTVDPNGDRILTVVPSRPHIYDKQKPDSKTKRDLWKEESIFYPNGSFYDTPKGKLRFHEKAAKYVKVSDEGTVASKIFKDKDDFGGVVTNRQLKDNEVFEVIIDELTEKFDTSIGIGVTYHNLKNIDYTSWMLCGTIMAYNHQLYESGTVTKKAIGPNLRNLKEGDRIGVVKKSNGDLHFLVNGVEQEAVASGITYPVYGVLDLFGKAVKATIID